LSVVLGIGLSLSMGYSAEKPPKPAGRGDLLPEAEWQAVENSVDRGLHFLAGRQRADGGFDAQPENEPGITGLCVLAFLSRGHLPGEGPFGETLTRAIDFVIGSQQRDGLVSRARDKYQATYCHGIGSLVLSEVYGLGRAKNEEQMRQAIENAVRFAGQRLSQPKRHSDDDGSWRYLARHRQSDGDLSITSWHLMFLRSARNAGFEVDVALIDDALGYLRRVYDPAIGSFRYEIHTDFPPLNHSRGMAGAGLLSLSLAGEHESPLAKKTARYILDRPFDQYDRPIRGEEYQCYSAFYCSQAMFQQGRDEWKAFYPPFARTLTSAQADDGAWRPREGKDAPFGAAYTTAITILALSPPFQMLPIFQK
jgi:hypothetical protein